MCAKLEAEAVDGERRALEVLDRNGELEGSAPSSISAYGPADPTPRDLQALTVLKSMPLLPDPPNTGFCSLATNFDHESPSSLPQASSGSSARSICAARGRLSLRTHVPILVIRSILPLLAFVFCLSLVARRRSARAYRRPRARPRRGEGVQDMQLDGTVASRRIWRSSRSPVPVPVAHCAPRMQCRSTPPTLVPRPHRG